MNIENRFWNKVEIRGANDCWEWKAGKYPNGYGIFWKQNKNISAHRMAYELCNGNIVKGMFICHKCDNPGCVNPNHLFLGSPKDNTQDMISKERIVRIRVNTANMVRGSAHHLSKLSFEQVKEIRSIYQYGVRGCGVRVIAKKYGVAPNTIFSIINKLTRKDS